MKYPRVIPLTAIMSEMRTNKDDYSLTMSSKPIIIGDLFVNGLIQKYGTFSFLRMYQDEDVSDYDYFYNNIYDVYRDSSASQLEHLFDAMQLTYNPINNYKRTETVDYKKEYTHGKSTTNTANNFTSTTTYNSNVTDKVTTFDDSNFRNGSKTDKGGNDTNVLSGSMTTADSGIDTETRHAADNINSVTGTNGNIADLIASELDLRARADLEDFIIRQFATQYLFIAGDNYEHDS